MAAATVVAVVATAVAGATLLQQWWLQPEQCDICAVDAARTGKAVAVVAA